MSELILEPLVADIKKEFPNFKLVPKSESTFMKVLAFLLRIIGNKTFMESYITTINTTVYTHAGWDASKESSKAAILRHERVHMRQARKYTFPLYAFLYLLFPLPLGLAWFRAKFEMEAYKESMRATYWLGGLPALQRNTYKEYILSQFLTGVYGWMWPFRHSMEVWYAKTCIDILVEEIGVVR